MCSTTTTNTSTSTSTSITATATSTSTSTSSSSSLSSYCLQEQEQAEQAEQAEQQQQQHLVEEEEEQEEEEQEQEEELYRLRDHCHYLNLKTERTSTTKSIYWYCDWTNHFVPNNITDSSASANSATTTTTTTANSANSANGARRNTCESPPLLLLTDIVQEYCQPFGRLSEYLQECLVGISALSEQKEDPLPVRTISIRLRPDAKQWTILQAVHEAFGALHNKHYHICKSTMNGFQAIGADGAVPFWITAMVATHKTTLERRLWLRFYHITDISIMEEEILQRIGGVTNQKAPLRNAHTPMNTKLAEACVLVQYIMEQTLIPSDPCPANAQEETTEWFQTTYTPSVSVLQANLNLINDTPEDNDRLLLFPSLAKDDYGVLQESYPLLERIWSELEMAKCTYNTLIHETSRFGMRPCQPTLDKDFCWQLAQISQLHMLMDLQQKIVQAETILHDTLNDYHELELLLIHTVMRKMYNIPVTNTLLSSSSPSSTTSSNLDIGQTPIALPKRKFEDFPWNDSVKNALNNDVSHWIAAGCLNAFDPLVSLTMADQSVHHVFTKFGVADDMDQKDFLKKRNRQAMIRLYQQQSRVKRLLATVILAPTNWPNGCLPKLQAAVDKWYAISGHAKTSNIRRNQVPLIEFKTKLGVGCITSQQLILQSTIDLVVTQRKTTKVFDWIDIDVKATPKHPLCKLVILENGRKVAGCHPVQIDVARLVKLIHTLKSLQSD